MLLLITEAFQEVRHDTDQCVELERGLIRTKLQAQF